MRFQMDSLTCEPTKGCSWLFLFPSILLQCFVLKILHVTIFKIKFSRETTARYCLENNTIYIAPEHVDTSIRGQIKRMNPKQGQ